MDNEQLKYQIGSNIASARKSCGMTQAELAERIGYSDKAVSKWERAESVPDVFTLAQLAKVFGISLDALVGETAPQISDSAARPRRVKTGVLMLSTVLVWFVALLVHVVLSGMGIGNSWLCFVYAIPATGITLLSLRAAFGRNNWNYALISMIIWGSLLSLYVSLLVFAGKNVWKLFLLGVLGQVALTMWFRMLLPTKEERAHG